jgi:hypothetical protein
MGSAPSLAQQRVLQVDVPMLSHSWLLGRVDTADARLKVAL